MSPTLNKLRSSPLPIRWQKLLQKTLIWLAAEIILNSLGVDTLADYSEFVFTTKPITQIRLL